MFESIPLLLVPRGTLYEGRGFEGVVVRGNLVLLRSREAISPRVGKFHAVRQMEAWFLSAGPQQPPQVLWYLCQ